jgi:hypothetical protein
LTDDISGKKIGWLKAGILECITRSSRIRVATTPESMISVPKRVVVERSVRIRGWPIGRPCAVVEPKPTDEVLRT